MHQYDRRTPEWTAEVLEKFGRNHFGVNIYRVVWGESRMEMVGGTWLNRLHGDESNHVTHRGRMIVDSNPVLSQSAEYRTVPRYPGKERWVLEKWLPCSYSRDDWYSDSRLVDQQSGLHLCGPFPEHGDYHAAYVLEVGGEYIDLTAGVLEYYCRLNEAAREHTDAQRRNAIEDRVMREKRDWENRVDDIFDDSQPAFGVTSIMSGSGEKTKDRTRPEDVKFEDVNDLPDWMPKQSGFHQI